MTFAFFLSSLSCSHLQSSPYESSTPQERETFKKVSLPFLPGTEFKISQGAFGKYTHNDRGHEYTWDFDVPLGTPILSVRDGTALQVFEPGLGGGCDPKFNESAQNIKIRHLDGTVAQYVHIQSRVKPGEHVRKGQIIAVTALNGFICNPQLDFGIYQDEQHLFGSGKTETLPLLFEGMPGGGIAHEGWSGTTPELASAVTTPICSNENYQKNSALLESTYVSDQSDRKNYRGWTATEMVEVQKHGQENRKRVLEIYELGCLKSADDFFRAAIVFQHGDSPDHYFQAYHWSLKSFQMGKKAAGMMVANTIDRYLKSLGYRQLFGGQADTYGPGKEIKDLCFCLWPIEKSFPDSKRAEFAFLSRSQIKKWLKDLNQGRKGCSQPTCPVPAKPVPAGMFPKIW
jgi:hypothetical protein